MKRLCIECRQYELQFEKHRINVSRSIKDKKVSQWQRHFFRGSLSLSRSLSLSLLLFAALTHSSFGALLYSCVHSVFLFSLFFVSSLTSTHSFLFSHTWIFLLKTFRLHIDLKSTEVINNCKTLPLLSL
jgi:hypothetical protein